jgi:hypothetical protein
MAKEELLQAVDAFKVTMDAAFVPYSQSRHKADDWKSLNWRVTVRVDGREVITTDYAQGVAHCPAHHNTRFAPRTYEKRKAIEHEIETGLEAKYLTSSGCVASGKPIAPPAVLDVVYSLVSDANVLDYPSFCAWAEDFGYDLDSRKAEATYRTCLEIALELRAALGYDGFRQLQEACQDY